MMRYSVLIVFICLCAHLFSQNDAKGVPAYIFHNNNPEILAFYHSFSDHPLVGKVTVGPRDIKITCRLLKKAHDLIQDPIQRKLITAEILTKVLAYRTLHKGEIIPIPVDCPTGCSIMTPYYVDCVFDLWNGIPAYGLVPHHSAPYAAPILLFRGTECSFTLRGISSILADIDIRGPGYALFLGAQRDIHRWLVCVGQRGLKPQVMGYSLGGVLSAYSVLYEYPALNIDEQYPSYCFEGPGVSPTLLKRWYKIPPWRRPYFNSFVNQGDIVPRCGKQFGRVQEFCTNRTFTPLGAHLAFMLAQPICFLYTLTSN